MSNQHHWGQGQRDAQNGKGAANQHGQTHQQREAYNAGYHHQQQQQQKKG